MHLNKTNILCCLSLLFLSSIQGIMAQDSTIVSDEVYINHGSVTGALSPHYLSSFTIGQQVVGSQFGSHQGDQGFWSRYLRAPSASFMLASEGEFSDRVLLTWEIDALSPYPSEGFKIYRDGAFLTTLSSNTFEYIDFNVIPGIFYEYTLVGINRFGEGYPAEVVGFVNPNGTVTGQVTSVNGNPVQDVQITLEPTIGNSLDFSQNNSKIIFPYHEGYNGAAISSSFWVKLEDSPSNAVLLDLGKAHQQNWWLSTHVSGPEKGINFNIGNGASVTSSTVIFSNDPNGWQHLAFTYNGEDFNIYLNGELMKNVAASMLAVTHDLYVGMGKQDSNSTFSGKLDELRIYSKQLSQTEIIKGMHATVPSGTDGLVAYWKFDEGLGYKTFDLTENNLDGLISEVNFSDDRPDVLNAGRTDASGYYLIEGINYKGGQNFTVRPSKSFENNNALEFNASNQEYAVIDDFIPQDTGTIEVWFKPASLTKSQNILSNADFDLRLENGNLILNWGGTSNPVGALSSAEFVHFALTYLPNGSSAILKTYLNGQSTNNFTTSSLNWSSGSWELGRAQNGGNYFTGIIDEIVFYKDIRTIEEIQFNASPNSTGVKIEDENITAYFSFNESVGDEFRDQSIYNLDGGQIFGAAWTPITARPDSDPHEFNPPTRIITLNPSNTSADNIDFQDISTVSVSGFVRFQGTVCRSEGIEILVDGQSHVPPIITDAEGYFSGDFEPGSSFKLTPKFQDRQFIPGFYEINRIVVPKAGIVFNDQTKRSIAGKITGGLCQKSIVPNQGGVKLFLEAENTCFDQQLNIDQFGTVDFAFENLPPLPYNLSIEHPVQEVADAFNAAGGILFPDVKTMDVTDLEFNYRADPQLKVTPLGLMKNCLNDFTLNQDKSYEFKIETFEVYAGGECYLDSVELHIENGMANNAIEDIVYTDDHLIYSFRAGIPNLSGDSISGHERYFNATAEDLRRQTTPATTSLEGVVLGKKYRTPLLLTSSPQLPLHILRDPPGDKSYSYLKKGQKVCKTKSNNYNESNSYDTGGSLFAGPNFEYEYGFTWTVEFDAVNDHHWMNRVTYNFVNDTTVQTCYHINTDIQTSANDDVVGSEQGGDIIMGAAMNYAIGLTDVLSWNGDSCKYVTSVERYMETKGYHTQYLYSENFIRNDRIPQLIAQDSLDQAAEWQKILDINEEAKSNSIYQENISFDAGTIYESSFTEESSSTYTYEWERVVSEDYAFQLGFIAGGVGGQFEYEIANGYTLGGTTVIDTTNTEESGYHLEDDDSGDYFSVDVLRDPIYGTPVFKVKGGASSCPWEHSKTQPRDEPTMQMVQTTMFDVPATEKAVFNVKLGNESQAGHARVYHLQFNADSNPLGAIVNINGQPTTDPIQYELDLGEVIPVTITVEKGPVAYDYTDLELIFYSECERDRALNLHPDIPTDSLFEKRVYFDAHFVPSCSEVSIAQPLQDWVLTPAQGDQLRIVLNGYEKVDSLDHIKVQYRRIGGNGNWGKIVDLPRDSLGDDFEIVFWDVSNLSDGDVEIRAVSKCIAGLADGRSEVIRGRIEQQGPKLLGSPQPSDGVLDGNDQIYIEFSENIDCEKLTLLEDEADVLGYVGLIDIGISEAIDIDVSCSENRIYINPVNPNAFVENKNLRAKVEGIMDLVGNRLPEAIEWEFYVNRNALFWVEGNIDAVKYDDTPWQVTRTIRNIGGNVEPFSLLNMPSWLQADITAGDIAPGGSAIITFSVSDQIVNGTYSGQIELDATFGTEIIDIDLAVLCRPPNWKINPSDWEYNMTFTVELDIEGVFSEDPFDFVAAYVEDELRGFAYVEKVELNSTIKHLAFLTAYSNVESGEIVEFKIWDASDCLLYTQLEPELIFEFNDQDGTPNNPRIISTQNLILREIPIQDGWNWISFNLNMPNDSVGPVMESLENPDNLFIRSKTDIAEYVPNLNSWIGDLYTVDFKSMYQVRGTQADTIDLIGAPIGPDDRKILIEPGWNWIGYIPQFGASVDSSLKSLNSLEGDIVKNQTHFAQYVAGVGWIGSLDFMEAPNGYLLKSLSQSQDPDTLIQSLITSGDPRPSELQADARSGIWNVNPNEFEFSMNIIAVIEADSLNILKEDDEIGVFFQDEVRGTSTAQYIPALDKYLLFITAYGNESNELLHFKYHDAASGDIHDLLQEHLFVANDILGSVQAPEIFTMDVVNSQSNHSEAFKLKAVPNPFVDKTFLHFTLPHAAEVSIQVYDMLGTQINSMKLDVNSGNQKVEIPVQPANGEKLTAGFYLVTFETDRIKVTEKILLIK